MLNFIIALLVFLAAHVLPRATGFREWGLEKFGRKIYMAGYSFLSLGLLVWVVTAALNAPYIGFWSTTSWNVGLVIITMLIASILFAGAVTRANSLSISFKGGKTDLRDPGILTFTSHPIIWAFLLWSASHLLVNGDLVGVVLFGGMLLFSIIGMRVAERRATAKLSQAEIAKYKSLSSRPLLDRIKRAISPKFGVEIACGIALFFVLLFGHQYAIGVDPMGYF